jgi:hypothetical protein
VVWRREVLLLAVEAAGVDLQALGLALERSSA